MTKNEPKPKWFAGHGKAMLRQGLAELRAAAYSESNVAQPPGPGIFGTKTQGEVADERKRDSVEPAGHGVHGPEKAEKPELDATAHDAAAPSAVGERLAQAEQESPSAEPEHPEPERE